MKIENPNSSGQGYCAQHTENIFHNLLIKYGYTYSHSTVINQYNTKYMSHTYRYEDTDWVMGVKCWGVNYTADAHKLGSGRYTRFVLATQLERYLKRKSAELCKLSN